MFINTGSFISAAQTGSFLTAQKYRAGQVSLGNLSTSQPVTFSSLMPSTGYSVALTFDSTLGAAVSAAATSKTISGFTVSLSAGIAGGADLDYFCMLYN